MTFTASWSTTFDAMCGIRPKSVSFMRSKIIERDGSPGTMMRGSDSLNAPWPGFVLIVAV